jgi:hypothetical protein
MVKNKILATMSMALLLCGSLSSLQAIGVGDVGPIHVDTSSDWVDLQHNRYFDEHYTYDTNAKLAQYPHETHDRVGPAYVDDNHEQYHVDRVHGHPVSIQFNPDKSGNIVADNFVLRDAHGKVVETKVATYELNDRQFAVVPAHRLDWDEEYRVSFRYSEDGVAKEEAWSFRTEALEHSLYTLEDARQTHDVARGSTYAFYDKQASDVADARFEHNGGFRVEKAVDHDTYYAEVEAAVGSNVSATVNGKEHQFHIFTDEIKKLEFADVDDHSVTLRWEHDKNGEEKGYKIYRDGKFLASVSADRQTYRDDHVKAGVTYAYTVKVTNDKI